MRIRYRVLAVIIILSLIFIDARILFISYFNPATAGVIFASAKEEYGSDRGLIFDRNLDRLVEYQTQLAYSKVNPKFSFEIARRYADQQTCAHIIGYTDAQNNGISGIEKDYNDYLKSIPNHIVLNTAKDAFGRILSGRGTQTNFAQSCQTSGVVLTIDKQVQEVVERCADRLKKGSAIVLDSETGEILAVASFPTFSPDCVAEALDAEDMPLINRALCTYNVGSVFKVVVCMAALEEGLESYRYTCTGKTRCGMTFHCHKTDGHGLLDMKHALALSCNTYFISLAQTLGYQKILALAKRLEIDQKIILSDSICAAAGNLPDETNLCADAALANFSFGQGELLCSPIALARIYAVIQNGGYLTEPSLVKGLLKNGQIRQTLNVSKKAVISKKTAQIIKAYLRFTVTDGTGKTADSTLIQNAGKTATAQTGKYKGKKEKLISYFIGFNTIFDKSYTILVMKEDGSSGSTDCAPIFKEISEGILRIRK